MSLDVYIKYKEKKLENYFVNHPYIYSGLSESDRSNYEEEEEWSANITHNLGKMASNIPVSGYYSLYDVMWHPEDNNIKDTTTLLKYLIEGLKYMIDHRKDLLQYNSENGWGTYEDLMKFTLNYKQHCEDNPDCEISVSR